MKIFLQTPASPIPAIPQRQSHLVSQNFRTRLSQSRMVIKSRQQATRYTMMISDKQLAANRSNALLSTGARTEEGRKRSRMNALRHGITGQGVRS